MSTGSSVSADGLDHHPSIQRTSLGEQTFRLLRQAAISGELGPGQIYSAQALAQEFGVSSSPVREAMLMLVNEGMMTPVRNRGYLVVPITDEGMNDIHELRVMTEVPAMVEVARRTAELDLAPFRTKAEAIIESAEDGDVLGYLDADRDFHLSLTDLLGNARLTKLVGSLRDHTRRFGVRILNERGQLLSTAQEHITIVETLGAGNGERIAELMTFHLGHILREWGNPTLT